MPHGSSNPDPISDPDDDRIVSHDAIFYVLNATSKLSVISS